MIEIINGLNQFKNYKFFKLVTIKKPFYKLLSLESLFDIYIVDIKYVNENALEVYKNIKNTVLYMLHVKRLKELKAFYTINLKKQIINTNDIILINPSLKLAYNVYLNNFRTLKITLPSFVLKDFNISEQNKNCLMCKYK